MIVKLDWLLRLVVTLLNGMAISWTRGDARSSAKKLFKTDYQVVVWYERSSKSLLLAPCVFDGLVAFEVPRLL
ncbi:hypothetical protein FN846DRAFT_935579, partial [Sphaerosporella brunnea]